MDLIRKLQIHQTAVESIARHDDLDGQVLKAALQRCRQQIDDEEAHLQRRIDASIKSNLEAGADVQ